MTRCPHCKAVANPLRFLIYMGVIFPYQCGKCRERSAFNQSQEILVALISSVAAIGGSIIASYYLGWSVFLVAPIAILLLGFLSCFLFVNLEPIDVDGPVSGATDSERVSEGE